MKLNCQILHCRQIMLVVILHLMILHPLVASVGISNSNIQSGVITLDSNDKINQYRQLEYTFPLKSSFSQNYTVITGIVCLNAPPFETSYHLIISINKQSSYLILFVLIRGFLGIIKYNYFSFINSLDFLHYNYFSALLPIQCAPTQIQGEKQCSTIKTPWNSNETGVVAILQSFQIYIKRKPAYFYQIKQPFIFNQRIKIRIRGQFDRFGFKINFILYKLTSANLKKYGFTQNNFSSLTPNIIPHLNSDLLFISGVSAVYVKGVFLYASSSFSYDIEQKTLTIRGCIVQFNYFWMLNLICPDSWHYDFILRTCIPDEPSLVTVAINLQISRPNIMQLTLIFSNPVIFRDTVQNSVVICLNNKTIPFSVLAQAEERLVIQLDITQSSGVISCQIVYDKIWDTKDKPLLQNTRNIPFKDIYISSEAQKTFTNSAASASSFAGQIVSARSILTASVFGLVFLFVNLIDVIQVISLYIFLEIKLPPNLNTVLTQLFQKQAETLYSGYAQIFRNFRYLVFLSTESPVQMSVNFIENNVEKVATLILSCFVFWVGAKLTERKIKNCIGKIFQKAFVFKIYSNCVSSYLSIQTRLAFTAAIVLREIQHNPISKSFLPFHVFGMVFFLFTSLIAPFLHVVCLHNTANLRMVRTKDNYFGTEKGKPFSIGLILSKTLFGPFIAFSIVLFTPSSALLFGTAVCFLNIGFELTAPFKFWLIQVFSAGSSISYLMFHLTICVSALKLLSGRDEWICGYVSLGFLGLIIVMRFCELCANLMSGFFTGKVNKIIPNQTKAKKQLSIKVETSGVNLNQKKICQFQLDKIGEEPDVQIKLDQSNPKILRMDRIRRIREMQSQKWVKVDRSNIANRKRLDIKNIQKAK